MKWALTLLIFCTNFLLVAAPAPLPRPNPRAFHPEGEWVMQWGSASYLINLTKDGGYSAVTINGTSRWEGSYKYEATRSKDGVWTVTLDIDERIAPSDPMSSLMRLSMKLEGDKTGKVWTGKGGAGPNVLYNLDAVLTKR